MSKKSTPKAKVRKGVTRYGRLVTWLLVVGVTAGSILIARQPAKAADVVVYKSPTCGCCKDWVRHLEANGFTVEVHNQRDLDPIKTDMGVPRPLRSCHTAKVGGYVIEGHVPADVIARLLEERPDIKGLAVPGMPMGSPGMEGPRKDRYDILTLEKSGSVRVYASR